MTGESRLTMRKSAAAIAAVVLLLIGAGGTYLVMQRSTGIQEQSQPASAGPTAPGPSNAQPGVATSDVAANTPLADVVVPVSREAIERAGIAVASVTSGTSGAELRLAGIVEPNAYRQVMVTPLVGGRITRVSVALGDRVRRGQTIAQIYSPELAEAQTRYVSARAMLDAHDRELQRTQKLVQIGAVSRQELERIHAEHAAQTAAVESARSQLELLGVPASEIDAKDFGKAVNASTNVPAPIDGVITERLANVGLNVDAATKLFSIVDLSTIWVVADAYERDFSQVRVGTEARITTSAYPGLALRGRVSYIDPLISSETRTAKLRIEVPNPRGELRFGMYADVAISAANRAPVTMIPRKAVQNVGDRTVVYLVNPKTPGTFVEREVRLGQPSGEQVEVTAGVTVGDNVVSEGSFFVRAECERLGLRPPGATGIADSRRTATAVSGAGSQKFQTAKIVVNEQGFQPATITVHAGTPAQITFVRTTDNTCATEVVIPSENIKRPLPLNQPVLIQLTPSKPGTIEFVCGMNMFKGVVVVQ